MELEKRMNAIESLLQKGAKSTREKQLEIIARAEKMQGLSLDDVAALTAVKDDELWDMIFEIAGKTKEKIYGNRIVMFAPLYISDYCVNSCEYCSYKTGHEFGRRRLTMEEIEKEAEILEKMGHKRIALEAGEDPMNCDIEYVLEAMKTIYAMKTDNDAIRRINVNIAATTVENYRALKKADIGTYILFQETYHKPSYEKYHKSGPKSDYNYHLTAFDRSIQGGVDDVGGGVLFGLYNPYYELMGLMIHNKYLEEKFGVGFHTISVPRLCPAEGVTLETFPHLVDDETFIKITALIRLAVPYTGMILSTREDGDMRKTLLKLGISQMSAGSSTDVGGYDASKNKKTSQFEVHDNRPMKEILSGLLEDGYIPSFCTGCYRSGRTGDRFMKLAKTGEISNVCLPNSLLTLYEYAVVYGDDNFRNSVKKAVTEQLAGIKNSEIKEETRKNLDLIESGVRDLYL